MKTDETRRTFLKASALATAANLLPRARGAEEAAIKVLVWDERQPKQKLAYENFLGNQIAEHLRAQPGLSVKSVALDDPDQGISEDTLKDTDVLIWWGHARHAEVTPETGRRIVARILSGDLGLIALHSAHFSTPFVEAMNERARQDARRDFPASAASPVEFRELPLNPRYSLAKADARLTPYYDVRKFPDGKLEVDIHPPICCFPSYREDGKPSAVRVLKPDHPIAKGLPATFEIPQTEMYSEPFHVPEPDAIVLEERWATGEWFRSGMVWGLGKGHVLYFRPGHESYPIYKQPTPLQIVTNAVRWMGGR